MTSLLEKLNGDWEDYTEIGKQKFLTRLTEEYSKADYYHLMGADKNNDFHDNLPQVKGNYKKLALKLHPDRNRDKIYSDAAEALLKLVNTAYEVLSDEKNEKSYRLTLFSEKMFNKDDSNPKSSNFTTYTKHSSSKPQKPHTYTSHNTFTTFGSNAPKTYNRDIKANESISAMNESICINGNVYGTVNNMNGPIIVNGSVFGTLQNLNGPNVIRDNVEKTGTVINLNGPNSVQGNMHGIVRNMMGKNKLQGLVDGEVIKDEPNSQSNVQHVQCTQQ